MSGSSKDFRRSNLLLGLLSSTALLGSPVLAQQAAAPPVETAAADYGDIIVTAQKRSQSLQAVPLSIQAFGSEKLNQLQVKEFGDVVRFLPSVTLQSSGPGFTQVYFRGVASGENANHSTSQPTVGVYLDEQPITTIQGALDIHAYDLARVEALAGPQGTLFGSSSMAGTIRIITNRPDPTAMSGSVDAELNTVAHGSVGGVLAGYVNVPISPTAAVRAVGWYRKDGGYIDNVAGRRTFPSSGIVQDNEEFVEDNYNDVETIGGRIALGIDLNDNWTITPTVIVQQQKANGSFSQESSPGFPLPKLQTRQYNPEGSNDRWLQAALTVEGKIGDWDLTYAGAYLTRKVESSSDYSDYAYFYDKLFGSGAYISDNAGELVSPNQYINAVDRYTKQSHELRITSPTDRPLTFIGGIFYQRQTHNIEQNYIIDDIADSITVTGTASNIWLTKQFRVDRDYAAFGELTYDITEKLSATGGIRVYRYDNSLQGFFGYSAGFSSRTGEAACFGPAIVDGSPCTNVDKSTADTDFIHKLNLTYRATDDALVYATWSRGFRPGGVNRRGELEPYLPDTLANFEIGWKTSWADRRLRFNGAVYQQNWEGVQLSFLGLNGLSEVRNAGKARIRGIEADIGWRDAGFTFNAGGNYNDSNIRVDFCKFPNDSFDCGLPGPPGRDGLPQKNELLAPAGSRLPVTAKFKGNALARYDFDVGEMTAHVQGALNYVGGRRTDLRVVESGIKGYLDPYTTVDLSAGIKTARWRAELFATNLFDSNGALSRGLQCGETICGDRVGGVSQTDSRGVFYTSVIRPRLIGIKFGVNF